MKKNSQTLCEEAASRVQSVADRDKIQKPAAQLSFQNCRCNPIKYPRIPSQIKDLPLQGYVLRKKLKTEAKSAHIFLPSQEPLNKEALKNLSELETVGKELDSNRIVSLTFKEHELASRKLKTVPINEEISLKGRQCTLLFQLPKKSTDEATDYWEEMLKAREERQFQIGRVTKYLVD